VLVCNLPRVSFNYLPLTTKLHVHRPASSIATPPFPPETTHPHLPFAYLKCSAAPVVYPTHTHVAEQRARQTGQALTPGNFPHSSQNRTCADLLNTMEETRKKRSLAAEACLLARRKSLYSGPSGCVQQARKEACSINYGCGTP
jgi:hypothetical protein